MIRLSKLADYSIVLLTHFARAGEKTVHTARELAEESQLPLPTVSKILKALSRADILLSHRGKTGGYSLARTPNKVSVVDIIAAIDGPIAITECSATHLGNCDLESACPVRSNWQRINLTVVRALSHLTLADMQQPLQNHHAPAQLVQLAERSSP